MPGIDATTGQPLGGLDHVIQSIGKIFSTPQVARIMREYFGNPGIRLLGENLTEDTILRWWTVTWACLVLFEPRFRVRYFKLLKADRRGAIEVLMVGEYRPYAHRDFVQARLYVSLSDGGVSIREAT